MKINIWKAFSILFTIFIMCVKAQNTVEQYKIDSLIYIHKSIGFKKDTINFLEIIKPSIHQKKKDLILFLQGSDPSPLISEDDNGKFLLLPLKNYRTILSLSSFPNLKFLFTNISKI